ncbi:MAG: cpaE1, partial [Acidimicrobiales bacterium]|nr:cpaE1 [Acidimicrobiales bacterium]
MTRYVETSREVSYDPGHLMGAMANVPTTDLAIPVVVIEADGGTRARLAMQLGERAVPLESVAHLGPQILNAPFVLVLGPSCAHQPGMLGAEELVRAHPGVGAILIAEDLSTDLFQQAIRNGVRDVLAAPVDTSQLNEAVRRVGASLQSVPRMPEAPQIEEVDGERGHVITVFSTKGG